MKAHHIKQGIGLILFGAMLTYLATKLINAVDDGLLVILIFVLIAFIIVLIGYTLIK